MAVRSVRRPTMNDALSILLARFRRRLIAARVMRLIGTAAALLAAACLAGALVGRISGAQLLARTISIAVIAAGLPAIVRLRRLPTIAAAALEIDQQKNLYELLSSAVLADGHEDLSDCVTAAARQKAGEVDVAQLKAGSQGTSMWIAALLIAGLLPLLHRSPVATSLGLADEVAGIDAPAQQKSPRATASSDSTQRRLSQEAQTPGAAAITVPDAADQQQSTAASRRPSRSDTAGISAGGGLAQGPAAAPPVPPTIVMPLVGDPGRGTAQGSGTVRANSTGDGDGIGQVSTTRGNVGAGDKTPAVAQEHGTVSAESFPESYRDVLKAYFAR